MSLESCVQVVDALVHQPLVGMQKAHLVAASADLNNKNNEDANVQSSALPNNKGKGNMNGLLGSQGLVLSSRSINSDVSTPIGFPGPLINPRKHKAVDVDEPMVDDRVSKRQRNEFAPVISTNGGPVVDVKPGGTSAADQQKTAMARKIEEQNKMFAARKLSLVLDLDHTLLNSAKFKDIDPIHDEVLRRKEKKDRDKPQRHLYRLQHMGMWTKLRPGIWNFLERASKLFQLHIYTMGNKSYATEMAKVLDPTGSLFADRVISREHDIDPLDGNDQKVHKVKDLDRVLGMESAAVIIDDSVEVWPHNKLNLIVVKRYTYFPCSRRQLGLHGPSLLEADCDESQAVGTLSSSLAIIERIHNNFFSHHSLINLDVRNLLAAEQRKILAGCRIVFSRILPVEEANPHLHPLWQAAEQCGAVCTNQIDEQVTHVVAKSLGTDKVNWALSTGRFVVHWHCTMQGHFADESSIRCHRVEASSLLYRRAKEVDFAIKK